MTNGMMPFWWINENNDVIERVCGGERLRRPEQDCPDNLWAVLESCWQPDPRERPAFAQLVNTLGGIAAGQRPEPRQAAISADANWPTASSDLSVRPFEGGGHMITRDRDAFGHRFASTSDIVYSGFC